MVRRAALLCFLFGVSCGDGAAEPERDVVLLLQTDLTPGLELAGIEVFTDPADAPLRIRARLDVTAGDDWASAPRELTRLPRGELDLDPDVPTDLVLRARDRNGREALRWRRVITPSTERVEIRLYRSCRGVRCDLGQCLGGRCVPEDCLHGDEVSCPPAACMDDAQCTGTDDECIIDGRCVDGTCFLPVDHTSCGEGLLCELGRGCVPSGAGQPDGTECAGDASCASGACVDGTCCDRPCSSCETCVSGACAPRPLAPSTPSAEVCDGFDNDCNGVVDDLVPNTTMDCGACGFRCAADEVCGGPRCTVGMPCERYLGLPCADVELGRITAPRTHGGMDFGAVLALTGDLLAVAAPRDDWLATGIAPAPESASERAPREEYGAVYLLRREPTEGWRFEATLRHPGPLDALERSARYGTHLAAHGDRVAVAGRATNDVHVYAFDGSAWSGPEILADGEGPVRGITFLGDGRLVTLRAESLEVEAGAGQPRIRIGITDGWNLAPDGRRLVVLDAGGRLRVGTPADLRALPIGTEVAVTPSRRPPLLFAGSRLFVGGPFEPPDGVGLRVIAEGDDGWSPVLELRSEHGDPRALATIGNWLVAGFPSSRLTSTPDLVGADTRLRPGPALATGAVFLYPGIEADGGIPLDAPLYLHASLLPGNARYGASLATDGEVLFIGAPGDQTESPDVAAPVAAAGAVYVRRLEPSP